MASVTIERFVPEQSGAFADMTYPAYRHLLSMAPATRHQVADDPRAIQPIAVAAWLGDQPAGLALAELPLPGEEQHAAELLSLFVLPGLRGKGVGRALLHAIEQLVARLGQAELRAVYMRGKPAIDIMEHLFERQGWSLPEPRMVTVKFMVEELYQAKWLHRYPPRKGYEIFTWMDLKDSERTALQRSQAETGWIESDLQPWDYDQHDFEPITSVGMRFEGDVVGWVINHRLADDTVRYTCSFMRKDLQKVGGILPLYCESFGRLHRFGFKRGMFVAPLHHPRMAQFSRRWFGPWSYFIGETMGVGKHLPASNPTATETTETA